MTDDIILPIPLVPPEIFKAVNDKKLAVFVGAGVSRIMGCMGWEELAGKLVTKCASIKITDGSPCLNFRETEILRRNNDHKKAITICYEIMKNNGCEEAFFEVLKESFKPREEQSSYRDIYKQLYGLRGLFITTNADEHFDKLFNPDRVVYKNFDPEDRDPTKLYHIHGSIREEESLVLTVPRYIKTYREDRFREFLKQIFLRYTVLFVGYGMNEFELLDFIITKYDSCDQRELKHFILLPIYSGEAASLKFEQYYYTRMGITVVAYQKDENGYNQLYEVVKDWNAKIKQRSTYLYDSYKVIEEVVDQYEKAEKIFQIIRNDESQKDHFFEVLAKTSNPFPWLKPLVEREFFDPKNNPPPQEVPDQKGFFTIPRWNVLGYLENVAKLNSQNPSNNITDLLVTVVDSIINYADEKYGRIDNWITNCSIIRIIFAFPIEKITEEYIEFLRTSLQSKWKTTSLVASEIGSAAFPVLIRHEAKALLLRLLDIVLDYQQKDEVGGKKYVSVIEEYWLNDILEKRKPGIAKLCAVEAAEVALIKIRSIVNEDIGGFSTAMIPTIEDHLQTHFSNSYEGQLVCFVRDMYTVSNPKQLREKIQDLMKEEHPIFKRIAVYTINQHYNELKDLFWGWGGNPLDVKRLKHELYELMKANCHSFSKEQIQRILNWIETRSYFVPQEVEEKGHRDKVLAYRKREWLSAILETRDPDVISAYEKYEFIEPQELIHPGFDFWMETSWGRAATPIDKNALLSKSNADLARYLTDFKGTGKWDEPTQEDLSIAFRDCVSSHPEQFSANLEPFSEVGRLYQNALIWGLYDAWHAGKSYPWNNVLKFILELITSNEFWNEAQGTTNYDYRNQTIAQIADLIEEGTRDDRHAFESSLLSSAEEILLVLIAKTKSDTEEDRDFMFLALNSLKGRIFSAMISYSLRYARLYGKEKERWAKAIKQYFHELLSAPARPPIEFSVTLGRYFPSLYYLDKDWVVSNVNQIFPVDDEQTWEATFTGYLYSTNAIYSDLYLLLRENGHYRKGLGVDFEDKHCTQRIADHICVGYMEEMESLEDQESLISKLIWSGSLEQVSEVISFFWMLRDKVTDKIRVKVRPLWDNLVKVLSQNKDDPEYLKAISDLSRWLSLIDSIDDQVFEWLKLSASYIETNFNSSFLIEYLLAHAAKTPEKVGKILLHVLGTGVYPQYKKENVQDIVRELYAQGQKEIADSIFNLYLEKGIDFLKPIYEENIKGHSKPG